MRGIIHYVWFYVLNVIWWLNESTMFRRIFFVSDHYFLDLSILAEILIIWHKTFVSQKGRQTNYIDRCFFNNSYFTQLNAFKLFILKYPSIILALINHLSRIFLMTWWQTVVSWYRKTTLAAHVVQKSILSHFILLRISSPHIILSILLTLVSHQIIILNILRLRWS